MPTEIVVESFIDEAFVILLKTTHYPRWTVTGRFIVDHGVVGDRLCHESYPSFSLKSRMSLTMSGTGICSETWRWNCRSSLISRLSVKGFRSRS